MPFSSEVPIGTLVWSSCKPMVKILMVIGMVYGHKQGDTPDTFKANWKLVGCGALFAKYKVIDSTSSKALSKVRAPAVPWFSLQRT
jgi:hypothetical protein